MRNKSFLNDFLNQLEYICLFEIDFFQYGASNKIILILKLFCHCEKFETFHIFSSSLKFVNFSDFFLQKNSIINKINHINIQFYHFYAALFYYARTHIDEPDEHEQKKTITIIHSILFLKN